MSRQRITAAGREQRVAPIRPGPFRICLVTDDHPIAEKQFLEGKLQELAAVEVDTADSIEELESYLLACEHSDSESRGSPLLALVDSTLNLGGVVSRRCERFEP